MENLKNIIRNHLSEGIILMDLIHNLSSDFVKIIIDSPKNIPIKETSRIAKLIKNDNSIISMFPNGCRLEVTTPGIGTKLVEKFQYEKNIGRNIYIKYIGDDAEVFSDIFLLVDVEDENVIVKKRKKNYSIMFKNIILAKIKVSFD